MNILAITSLFPSAYAPWGGIFNAQQLKHLSPSITLSLVAPIPWKHWLRPKSKTFHDFSDRFSNLLRPSFFYPPRLGRGWHGQCYYASIYSSVKKLTQNSKFDLVYGMFAYPDGWAAAIVAKKYGLPFVLKVHGSDIHQLSLTQREKVLETLNRADHIVSVSKNLAEQTETLSNHKKISVVRNGIDFKTFHALAKSEARKKLGLGIDRVIVLFAGRLEKVKGADLLPSICRAVGDSHDWVVAGTGSLKEKLQKEWKHENLRFLGECSQEILVRWYCASDIIIFPSRNEGIPNGILESLACDRPVVATRVGGIPEVLVDPRASRIVPSEDISSFAKAIHELLENPPPKEAARKMVAHLTWEQSAKHLENVFQEAVRDSKLK